MHKDLNDLLIDEFLQTEFQRLHLAFPQARALDIGCGDLRHAKYLTSDGWVVIYSDHEERADGVDVLLDAHYLPFPNECFDIILMTEVLEHLHHPQLALKEISRILKPNGSLVITFPFLWHIHEIPFDFFRFTEYGFSVLASDAGLRIERFKRRGDSFALLLSLIDMKIMGVIHLLSKKKHLKLLSIALRSVASFFAGAIYWMYLRVSNKSNALVNLSPGDNLNGPIGKLRLWHLGYNIICKKSQSICT